MSVTVRELVAWGLDESLYRPKGMIYQLTAKAAISCQLETNPLVMDVPAGVAELMSEEAKREDLHVEMEGLEWTTGLVDLRGLIAFQRRLIFDEEFGQAAAPTQDDWGALVKFAFGPRVSVAHEVVVRGEGEWVVRSANPNMQLRKAVDGLFAVCGGSPFFEVAEYRGRWFLRDGYHRAYRLLRAGLVCCPAVIVRARTLAELGPVQPWFFAEDVLFGSRPPLVVDFLEDALTIEYRRPRLYKTLRVRIEESMELGSSGGVR